MNQAAVSRLERGKGLVPLSLVVRLGRAIGGNLIDRTLLSDAGERLLAALETLAPRGAEPWLPMTRDPGIRNLIHCYLRAPSPAQCAPCLRQGARWAACEVASVVQRFDAATLQLVDGPTTFSSPRWDVHLGQDLLTSP